MSRHARLRQLANSGSSILLARVLNVLLSIGSLPLVARALGPSGRGEVAFGLAVTQMLPFVVTIGFLPLLRREWATSVNAGARLTRAARKWAVVVAAVMVPLAYGIAHAAKPYLSGDALRPLVVAMVVCASAGLCWLADASALAGKGATGRYAALLLLPSMVLTTCYITLYLVGELTVGSVFWSVALAYAISSVAASFANKVSLHGPSERLGSAIRRGAPYSGSTLAEALSFRLDQVVALPVLGAHGAGLYSIAATIGLLPLAAGEASATAVFKQVVTQDGDPASRHERAGLVRLNILLGVLICLFGALTVPVAVPVLFGEGFRGAVLPTIVSLAGAFSLVVGQACTVLLIASDSGWRLSLAQIVGLGAGVLILLVLGPKYGAFGASLASTIGYTIATCVMALGCDLRFTEYVPTKRDFRNLLSVFTTGRLSSRQTAR